jgi:hypothetical protein
MKNIHCLRIFLSIILIAIVAAIVAQGATKFGEHISSNFRKSVETSDRSSIARGQTASRSMVEKFRSLEK